MCLYNANSFTAVTLPPYHREQIVVSTPVGSLIDASTIHRVIIETVSGYDTARNKQVTTVHEALVVNGHGIMEIDGKPARFIGDVRTVTPLDDASHFYADYDRLLPFDLRHKTQHHGPVFQEKTGEPVHLVLATFGKLDGSRWQRELLILDQRRIIGADGCTLDADGYLIKAGKRDAGNKICGYEVVADESQRPENSVYYRHLTPKLAIAA